MPSPILARADALMQRRLHGHAATDDVPTLTDAICTDGIPLLLDAETEPAPPIAKETEISAITPDQAASPAEPLQDTPPLIAGDLRDDLARELARRVEQRILAELPRIIESTLHDFLAEQDITENTPPRA